MTQPAHHTTNAAPHSPAPGEEEDALKAIMPVIPVVLPVVGGLLMLLLAFIAVYMS